MDSAADAAADAAMTTLPLGTATGGGAVTCPDGSPASARCFTVEIRGCGAGVPALSATLRVREPVSADRGTILLGSGGRGTTFYGDGSPATLIGALNDDGFRTVERAWAAPWEACDEGMKACACRYATLSGFVRERLLGAGGFCATGNSGGSAEISYALAYYGADAWLDFALPTSGPPMGRLDHGCLDHADPTWNDTCHAHFALGSACTTVDCALGAGGQSIINLAYPTGSCGRGGAPGDAAARDRLLADSVAGPDANLDYAIPVSFLYGELDCTSAVPLGLEFSTRVRSIHTIEWVPRAMHGVMNSANGQARIRALMDATCAAR